MATRTTAWHNNVMTKREQHVEEGSRMGHGMFSTNSVYVYLNISIVIYGIILGILPNVLGATHLLQYPAFVACDLGSGGIYATQVILAMNYHEQEWVLQV